MKAIAVLGLVAGLLTVTPTFAQSTGTGGLCGPDGPEAYKRPGGYCEQLDKKSSLSEPGTGHHEAPSEIQVEELVQCILCAAV